MTSLYARPRKEPKIALIKLKVLLLLLLQIILAFSLVFVAFVEEQVQEIPWQGEQPISSSSPLRSSATGADNWDTLPQYVDRSTPISNEEPWDLPTSSNYQCTTSRKTQRVQASEIDTDYDKCCIFDAFALHSDFQHQELFCEYKGNCTSVSDFSVIGRLKQALPFWENVLKPNDDIVSCVKNGYVIPFSSQPPSFQLKNNKSALNNSEFVENAIKDLLQKQCIYEVPFLPHNVNPLSVATNNASGKKRLILDLSVLNTYVKKDHVKFEDYKVAKELLIPQGYMYKFDLSIGYHHISIKPIHHSFLGFSWLIGGRWHYFLFSVLPFGLSSAPFIFTKLLRPLIKYWRTKSLSIVLFLDDGWGINGSFELALADANLVKSTLLGAGFLINLEKSILVPVQILEWFGYIWDLQKGILKIPERRIQNTLSCINSIKRSFPWASARELAKLSGKIVSMMPVLGNVCLLQTKCLYQFIDNILSWDSSLNIAGTMQTIQFWERQMSMPFCKKLFQDFLPSKLVFSDASNVAGAACMIDGNKYIAHRAWNASEVVQSSTYREMLAIHYSLKSFLNKLRGKRVIWYTDSKNCVNIIERGSQIPELQQFATIKGLNFEYSPNIIGKKGLEYQYGATNVPFPLEENKWLRALGIKYTGGTIQLLSTSQFTEKASTVSEVGVKYNELKRASLLLSSFENLSTVCGPNILSIN